MCNFILKIISGLDCICCSDLIALVTDITNINFIIIFL